MKTSIITGAVLSISLLGASAVSAANYIPQEPYADFAIESNSYAQDVADNYTMSSELKDLFWGDGVDALK